jgi:phytanoyl-CoA hydroxylase
MYSIKFATGQSIQIPATADEDQPYFDGINEQAVEHYREQGYVVIRGAVPRAICGAARRSFASEVKTYDGFIYRQTTCKAERNIFNERGYVMNPVLNVQSLPSRRFGEFKKSALEALTHQNIQRALGALLGEQPKLVQTMYFEGNTSTWPHQDTYYLDSENIGEMCGAWVALEDIAPNAGRFFICPGSHRIDIQKNGGDFDVAFNHARYKSLVIDIIKKFDLTVKAPALREGDVLLWNSKTIHGSLDSPQFLSSRQSLTAHYIPDSRQFLQFQSRVQRLPLSTFNGMRVATPKNQDLLKNLFVLFFEAHLPFIFYPLKNAAIKAVVR